MVTLAALWLPILVSAVLATFAGFLLWMLLPHHRTDWRRVPDESAVWDLFSRLKLAPGQYIMPYMMDPKDRDNSELMRKLETGPVAHITIGKPGRPAMGRNVGLQFVYHLIVSVFIAYLASHTLAAGTDYLQVFRVVGTAAILAYTAAVVPHAIWFSRPWGVLAKEIVDGVFLGLLTAGSFGAFWPR
jgi:hypothetical protein